VQQRIYIYGQRERERERVVKKGGRGRETELDFSLVSRNIVLSVSTHFSIHSGALREKQIMIDSIGRPFQIND
jgi:hypothetical protein